MAGRFGAIHAGHIRREGIIMTDAARERANELASQATRIGAEVDAIEDRADGGAVVVIAGPARDPKTNRRAETRISISPDGRRE